jgi:large subunit ribosomal protein L15
MATKDSNNVEEPNILRMHDLRPAPGANRDRIRVGRGEGSKGKTSGRGMKGTKARYQVRPGFEGGQLPLYMRLPKLRGFKSPFKKQYQVVNVGRLSELYPQGADVTPEDLSAKGAVRSGYLVKVLGEGDAVAAFNLKGVKVSASAKAKIEAAGGSVSED